MRVFGFVFRGVGKKFFVFVFLGGGAEGIEGRG